MVKAAGQELADDESDDRAGQAVVRGELPATADAKEEVAEAGTSPLPEEAPFSKPLEAFPDDGPQFYVARRALGEDVLEPVRELGVTGGLELSADKQSAFLYVKFPGDRGEIRALMTATGAKEMSFDNSEMIDPDEHKAFFRADASMAYIDYGIWSGMIRRTGGRGMGFGGMAVTFGANIAQAGKVGDLSDEPWSFEGICASVLLKDEDPIPEADKDQVPPNFRTVPKGTLIFTLWFDDGSWHYGKSAPVPLSLTFEPLAGEDAVSPVPADVVEHIRKVDRGDEKEKEGTRTKKHGNDSAGDELPQKKRARARKGGAPHGAAGPRGGRTAPEGAGDEWADPGRADSELPRRGRRGAGAGLGRGRGRRVRERALPMA